ncbi:ADP-ribosylation factor family protein [Theileria parva strain Muguga]|uniref:ADP-ribosylation factor family protein n=1 Tax=Theileria parva strain Muguga TaxID=333668 RepID=UPI001C61BBA6|nr:ADP-ribosylation factor family protein [Theileria parva strain Muguga]EAN33120.2 ADP-ribosylation factor family protein [Theileria parva strain Muguga]
MEFKFFIKTFPFNVLRFSGKLLQLSLRLSFLIFKYIFRSTTDLYANLLDSFNRPCENILILGARNSGKSSLLYRIKLSEFISTSATGSIIEEELYLCRFCLVSSSICGHPKLQEYDKVKVKLYELGYNDPISTYQQQIQICNKIIYVVDSFGDFRYSEINKEILTMISEHSYHHNLPKYVIFLAKNDIFGGMNYQSIRKALEFPEQLNNRLMVVKGSSITGEGVFESLSFLLFDTRENNKTEKNDLIVL